MDDRKTVKYGISEKCTIMEIEGKHRVSNKKRALFKVYRGCKKTKTGVQVNQKRLKRLNEKAKNWI